MDYKALQYQSWTTAKKLDYPVNKALPLLDEMHVERTTTEIADRVLAMHTVAAAAWGFERQDAISWLTRENLMHALTEAEREFLVDGMRHPLPFMMGVEAMWALCWCLNLVADIDFARPCAESLRAVFPDLLEDADSGAFRAKTRRREEAEMVANLDLAYCLHWGVAQANLRGQAPPGRVKPYVIVERRRALEWVLSTDDWDDISLDT